MPRSSRSTDVPHETSGAAAFGSSVCSDRCACGARTPRTSVIDTAAATRAARTPGKMSSQSWGRLYFTPQRIRRTQRLRCSLEMGVAAHLGIDLVEYDARIRTFIPDYDLMLDVAARAIPHRARTIVDLGIGTGALAARCRAHASDAHVVGIDSDGEILRIAAERIPTAATFVRGSFLRTRLPPADAVVPSFALHP